jgi:hypothetical protein
LLKYYKTTSDIYLASVVLDPRLKNEYYETLDNCLTTADVVKNITRVFETVYKTKCETTAPVLSASSSVIFSRMKKAPRMEGNELEEYLREPRVDENLSPFDYWKNNIRRFPSLSKMARDYLSVPATSASSERAFSGGTEITLKLAWHNNYRTEAYNLFAEQVVRGNGLVLHVPEILDRQRGLIDSQSYGFLMPVIY